MTDEGAGPVLFAGEPGLLERRLAPFCCPMRRSGKPAGFGGRAGATIIARQLAVVSMRRKKACMGAHTKFSRSFPEALHPQGILGSARDALIYSACPA
jgi:hypothetical protein